jgi:hypothetical protein
VISPTIALVQIRNDRKRRRHIERRAQAERVSAWPGQNGERQPVTLFNGSDEPVYEAVVTLVLIQGAGAQRGEDLAPELAGYRATTGVIPPGRWLVYVEGGWGGMYRKPGVEVAFTDRAGIHWVRRANGQLEEISQGAFEYFNLSRPLELVTPEANETC